MGGTQVGEGSKDLDRRLFLKRGITVAWATPTILTLMATSAAASHAGGPAGCTHTGETGCGVVAVGGLTCTVNTDASGVCCEAPTATCQPAGASVGQPCSCVVTVP